MGHNRLGRLPKRDRWAQVVDLLTADDGDAAAVAAASIVAAEGYLRRLATAQPLRRVAEHFANAASFPGVPRSSRLPRASNVRREVKGGKRKSLHAC